MTRAKIGTTVRAALGMAALGLSVLSAPLALAQSATTETTAPAIGNSAACSLRLQSERMDFSFCVDDSVWLPQDPLAVQEFLFYSADDRTGFSSIPETATVPKGVFRSRVLQNAAIPANNDPSRVEVVGEGTESWNGKEWNYLNYTVDTGDFNLFYTNYYLIEEGYGSIQMVYWSVVDDQQVAMDRAADMLATMSYE
ncbi:hypothetical protein [Devosia sp.]|uniref:hypothetical protein n=1 Tax=Devosia sp. TaxID=1871048 RepID=UPI003A911428